MARSGAASHLPATDTLSSPGLHRAPRNEKAAVHARFVGGQVQRVNIGSSSFKRHSHRRRDCRNACLPRHCAPSARRASSRIEGAFGRAMNAVALLGRGRAGLGLPHSGSSPRASGLLATFVALRKSANGTNRTSRHVCLRIRFRRVAEVHATLASAHGHVAARLPGCSRLLPQSRF